MELESDGPVGEARETLICRLSAEWAILGSNQ
jgi:hypothetical protein